ncbi:MAG: hypothetical protein AVDCRST_MAG83-2285 [uncultured Arthrobacter sp.]|uniref:Uncharacterized protein n=1 Tax=uncultured Arthrobacter sp. TaxID=114050 RepID=A0A6J4II93_9MICC|nr:MAG: hypothetical protein AVDCRST_MAG83-2285 [uncultured Arthrobacter sp.]
MAQFSTRRRRSEVDPREWVLLMKEVISRFRPDRCRNR